AVEHRLRAEALHHAVQRDRVAVHRPSSRLPAGGGRPPPPPPPPAPLSSIRTRVCGANACGSSRAAPVRHRCARRIVVPVATGLSRKHSR
ncbi:hypothetical protein K6W80_34430, partial [Burkholderia contaminans]|nr:hypothetical protein [Burkholderia contaminans]